jgi:phage-related protein
MWGWIAGIAALIAVLMIAWNKSATFRDVVLSAWEAIKVGFQAVVAYLTPAVTTVVNFILQQWQKIVMWWTTNGATILQAIQNVFSFLLPIIMTVINTIIPILQAAWNLIVTIIQTAWSIITTVISAAVTLVLKIISLFANVLTGRWGAAWNNIKTIAVTVWNLIKSVIGVAVNGISNIISSTMVVIRSVISSVWNGILSIISHVLSTIGNIIRNVWNSAKSTISGAMNSIKSLISNGFNAARNAVSNAASSIRSILSGLASQAYAWGSNLISMFGAGVKSKIDSVVAAARNAAAQIKSYLGFSSPTEKGPGANADHWASNLMSMFADGMNTGVPKIRMAATNAADATSNMQKPTNTTSNTNTSRQQPIINIYEAQRTTDKEILNAMRKAAFLYG